MKTIRIDLHTHSTASPDGGLTEADYTKLIRENILNYIAVTDHDRIDMAQHLQTELGDAIIVGQEITTSEGEIIGLFVASQIAPLQSALQTVKAIKNQGGLVYVPHPFETVRKGITKQTLDNIASYVDIVEVHNGRAFFQNRGPLATAWARIHSKAMAASSDAHGIKGMASTYTTITAKPSQENLVKLLATSRRQTTRPPLSSLLYPKYHRLRAKLKKTKKP